MTPRLRRPRHPRARKWCAATWLVWAVVIWPLSVTAVGTDEKAPLRVVLDDNYPPYIFKDAEGRLRGILPDQWALWEKKTGRRVRLIATDWAEAQDMIRRGEADAIDTLFRTPEREGVYTFGAPYAEIPVSVFHHETISGIPDLEALKGFAVAVKEGDAAVEVLKNRGVAAFLTYPSYESIVQAAASGTVKIFCMDDPPAYYLLAKYGILDHFKKGFTLYSGSFHRAVLKGREDLLAVVEEGFSALSRKDLEAIDRKWMGSSLRPSVPWRTVGWAMGTLALLVLLGLLWIVLLNARVRRKTQEVRKLLDESRRREEILRVTLEKHELTLQAASMSSWDWNVRERCVVRDASWAERRGLDPSRSWEDLRTWIDTVHPEDRSRVLARLKDHLEGRTSHYEAAYRVRNADGAHHWILDRGKVIVRDDAGKPVRMIGIETDITAQKTMEARLRLLTRVVEQSPLSIVITDPAGRIEYVNEEFCRLTGYRPHEVIGENPRLLQSGRTPRETYRDLWDTITRGRTWQGVFCNRTKDGSLYWEEAVICPIVDESGRIDHYAAMKQDITARKQLEEQLVQAQKMESVGRLAGGVAHDFNNALQIIMGYAEVALGLLDSRDRVHRMLNEIHKAARRSAGVVRQLLAFARKDLIRPVPLNLNEHLAEIHRMLKRLIGEEILLELRPGEDLWPVLLDPSQADQVVANLVINARDAIERSGTITLETQNVFLDGSRKAGPVFIPEGEYVRLSVTDTGCGMDAQTMEHIFEPFFTTKEVGKGTGLGLSTVYGIVKQNGGWIDVTSAPGEGTRFDLFFPRLRSDAHGRSGGSDRAREGESPRAGETVLVVEDEPLILGLAQTILRDAGYRVHAFNRPSAALQWVREHADPVHLLLTDVVMPEMSGRELWDYIKRWRPDVGCLFMSGYTADMLAHRGVGSEELHFIHKPFTADVLLRKIRRILSAKQITGAMSP
ncbi:PAS domain S-box-containing protein [Desulfacinum infernum DSM 9756]|uniref:histidine kinase n=1 Tax=Desulfacinum infernum DSM 9756 TaxID=1121391 RepID=A0A1M4YA33_9BACT|nr:transporter substrate-binding domain-containing protein [Desulfacinum infernum]SHF02372.1 PAS domain S-box-containing protein [Desulfacinum infernum DSM 9756]